MNTAYTHVDAPVGELLLVANDQGLTHLYIMAGKYVPTIAADWHPDAKHPVLCHARRELAAYFAGELHTFTVPLDPQGSDFQHRVWTALRAIPYGATRSYGEQASALGLPQAARAVGAANGRNPIGIIVPCHRVIGANGALTGYAGGMAAKRFLLELEARWMATRHEFRLGAVSPASMTEGNPCGTCGPSIGCGR